MLEHANIDHENKKLNRNAHSALEKVSYEILDYKSKLLHIKLPLFHIFHGLYEFIFLETYSRL